MCFLSFRIAFVFSHCIPLLWVKVTNIPFIDSLLMKYLNALYNRGYRVINRMTLNNSIHLSLGRNSFWISNFPALWISLRLSLSLFVCRMRRALYKIILWPCWKGEGHSSKQRSHLNPSILVLSLSFAKCLTYLVLFVPPKTVHCTNTLSEL